MSGLSSDKNFGGDTRRIVGLDPSGKDFYVMVVARQPGSST